MQSPRTAMSRQAGGAHRPAALQSAEAHREAAEPAQLAALCSAPNERLEFGPFSLHISQRQLLRDGVAVPLGGRAFDILVSLVARRGGLVTKEELLAEVWPSTVVGQSNLWVQMVALRKALDDGDGRLIVTDPGRGYRFTGVPVQAQPPIQPEPGRAAPPSRLAAAITRIIGRDDFIAGVVGQLAEHRLITIAGPGGIGKTCVATACAAALAGTYRDGACFVDLTKVTKPSAVPEMLARSLDFACESADKLRDVVQQLKDRRMLLVIDNCEHVIDATAQLVEALTAAAPGIHILATSREALRVTGEWVRVLPPLPSPSEQEGRGITAAKALTYAAVELFVERAAAAGEGFVLTDADAPLVAEICRRLDGVALAIELAVAKLPVFGLAWLAANLDDRLSILNHGRRTAVPRHQNLVAMLDWSYQLLTDQERVTLQRVAVFPGDFTMAEAIHAAGDAIDDDEVIDAISELVSKSLATLDGSGAVMRYRLPETTRAYAYAKLRTGPVRVPPAAMHARPQACAWG